MFSVHSSIFTTGVAKWISLQQNVDYSSPTIEKNADTICITLAPLLKRAISDYSNAAA